MENKMIKQVIVVRKDLNMRCGKIASQVAHASMKILIDLMIDKDNDLELIIGNEKLKLLGLTIHPQDPLYLWLSDIFTKIVVSCDSEKELLDIQKKAEENDILNTLITDVGKTEFNNIPTKTCIAIGPDYSEKIDLITSNLKLL